MDPINCDSQSRLFNDDRIIDKTTVSCVKWIKASFLVASFASGNLYFFNVENDSPENQPVYQLIKQVKYF